MKKVLFYPLAVAAILSITSCSDDDNNGRENNGGQASAETNTEATTDYDFNDAARRITLSGTSATADHESVKTEGSKVTITEEGTYVISGSLANGQLVIDADNNDMVKILLNGANITSSSAPAIDIENAEKVVIKTATGSENNLADGTSNPQDAAIYSKTKLTIFGAGSLHVDGNKNRAIYSEGGIIFRDANLTLTAPGDAVKTNFNLTFFGGDYTIASSGDGFNVKNEVAVSSADIHISQVNEGFEAGTFNLISGNIDISSQGNGIAVTGEGAKNSSSELYISGGSVYINAAKTGFLVNGSIGISGGTVVIESANDSTSPSLGYNGNFKIDGGYLIAMNNRSNIDLPNNTLSQQNSVAVNFASSVSGDTIVHIQDVDGKDVATFKPEKTFNTILISAAAFEKNETYKLYTGGSVNGDFINGLYQVLNYTNGNLMATFEIGNALTIVDANN